jgi:predicted metalloprotease with PDZ domain
VNSTVDYYDLGMLIAFDLDVALRAVGSSLDAAFGSFYTQHVGRGDGFTQADIRAFFGAIDPTINEVIVRAAERPAGLRVPASLALLGLELTTAPHPRIGVVLEKDTGPTIADVCDDGPAAQAGLAPGDVITTVDGFAYQRKALAWLIAHRESVTIDVRRGHRVCSFTVRPAPRTDVISLAWTGDETHAEKLATWLGRAHVLPKLIPLGSYKNFHGVQTII